MALTPGYAGMVSNADLPYAETVTGTGNFAVSDTATDDLMQPEMPPVVTHPYVPKKDALIAVPFATKEEVQDFKDQINSSFEEIANMLNELQAAIMFLNERLALFNTKAGHKI